MILLLAACSPERTPTWGFDPIYLEPSGADQVLGFHTWQVYDEPWSRNPDEKYYLCAVVTELTGSVGTSCGDDCTLAWDVASTLVESDCPDTLSEDPLFTSLIGIGLGEANPSPDAPHPGLTTVGWVDYGFGWEVHGDAWPETLDSGGTPDDGAWDGVKAFTFWPGALWPLQDAESTATGVSRLGAFGSPSR